MEQLHFITKLLDIKDPNVQIMDVVNRDTHKEIIVKLDYKASSCPECGSQMKKYDFQKASFQVLSLLESDGRLDLTRQEESSNSSYYQPKDCAKVN